jgi:hypothetical protein
MSTCGIKEENYENEKQILRHYKCITNEMNFYSRLTANIKKRKSVPLHSMVALGGRGEV